jgi:hypothetical protein
MKIIAPLLLLLISLTCVAQREVMYMKTYKIKSSTFNERTKQYEDLTDWAKSNLIFKLTGNRLTVDNTKHSVYTISNSKTDKDDNGTMITYDAFDEDYKKCDVIFFFPKLKLGEKQWNLIYIVYNDLMFEHQVRRIFPSSDLDNLIDNE